MVSLEFSIDCGPGFDSASNRNKEVTHFRVPIFSKCGSLKILVPSGSIMGLYRDYFTFYFNHLHYTRLFLLQNYYCHLFILTFNNSYCHIEGIKNFLG